MGARAAMNAVTFCVCRVITVINIPAGNDFYFYFSIRSAQSSKRKNKSHFWYFVKENSNANNNKTKLIVTKYFHGIRN